MRLFSTRLLLAAALVVPARSPRRNPPRRPRTAVADTPVAVPNAGFEASGAAAPPSGWSLDGVAPAGASVRRADAGHAGTAAIELSADTPASLAVLSETLALRVGHVYRLSAWVKTRGVSADPLARYPTAVPATLSMASFPFTNHSPAVGGTRDWTRVETDVRRHGGERPGPAGPRPQRDRHRPRLVRRRHARRGHRHHGVDPRSSRSAGTGRRSATTDRGWIFVHVEGEPYARGHQYGNLVADEIVAYIEKLAVRHDAEDPAHGWNALRTIADALMLRGYDDEYLEEMQGIADGAAADAGPRSTAAGRPPRHRHDELRDRPRLDGEAPCRCTPIALTGRTFLSPRTSSRCPTASTSARRSPRPAPRPPDGRVVFVQVFMWDGYTGVHFNVVLDVVPEKGHRFVMQTFPGGIHSGTDFYMNDAGHPDRRDHRSSRRRSTRTAHRRATASARRSSTAPRSTRWSAILRERNNGMYTNDWPSPT